MKIFNIGEKVFVKDDRNVFGYVGSCDVSYELSSPKGVIRIARVRIAGRNATREFQTDKLETVRELDPTRNHHYHLIYWLANTDNTEPQLGEICGPPRFADGRWLHPVIDPNSMRYDEVVEVDFADIWPVF